MVDIKHIEQIVEGFIATSPDVFLVDVSVSPSNKIVVLIDTLSGVTVSDCVLLSRAIEQSIDRETNDFELEVSSPGLTEPFRVFAQYSKYIGKQVVVLLISDEKFTGILRSVVENERIVLETSLKVKEEGKKKPVLRTEHKQILFNEIKTTKVLITF